MAENRKPHGRGGMRWAPGKEAPLG